MLLWKILVGVDVLINLGYWHAVLTGKERLERADAVNIPIGLVGTAGLITYAFSLPSFPEYFWRLFLPLYIAVAGWEVAEAAKDSEFNMGTLVGLSSVLVLVGFTSVAIYRLGGEHWIGLLGL